MTKTPHEARLEIHDIITEILVSLSVEEETTDEEITVYEQEMADIASIILDSLNLVVTEVAVSENGTTDLVASLSYEEGDPITEEELAELG